MIATTHNHDSDDVSPIVVKQARPARTVLRKKAHWVLMKAPASKKEAHVIFWKLAHSVSVSAETSRLKTIKTGFEPGYAFVVRTALGLSAAITESIFNQSMSTLERRLRNKQLLDPVASERLDRIALVANLAEDVFEDQSKAAEWLSNPNMALGNEPPIQLCETEIGAAQVRRVLHAIEWGNVA